MIKKTVVDPHITVEGKPLEVYLEEVATSEIEKVQSQQLREASRGTRYIPTSTKEGNISGKRSEYSNRIEKYSAEVLVHMNYLFQVGGEKLVNDFLSKPQTQEGSIESALRDAKEKQAFYTKEATRMANEEEKWTNVVQHLESTLDLVNGKTSTGPGRPVGNRPTLDWNAILRVELSNGGVSFKELRQTLERKFPEVKATSIYQGIHAKLKAGGVIVKDSEDIITYVGK